MAQKTLTNVSGGNNGGYKQPFTNTIILKFKLLLQQLETILNSDIAIQGIRIKYAKQ